MVYEVFGVDVYYDLSNNSVEIVKFRGLYLAGLLSRFPPYNHESVLICPSYTTP